MDQFDLTKPLCIFILDLNPDRSASASPDEIIQEYVDSSGSGQVSDDIIEGPDEARDSYPVPCPAIRGSTMPFGGWGKPKRAFKISPEHYALVVNNPIPPATQYKWLDMSGRGIQGDIDPRTRYCYEPDPYIDRPVTFRTPVPGEELIIVMDRWGDYKSRVVYTKLEKWIAHENFEGALTNLNIKQDTIEIETSSEEYGVDITIDESHLVIETTNAKPESILDKSHELENGILETRTSANDKNKTSDSSNENKCTLSTSENVITETIVPKSSTNIYTQNKDSYIEKDLRAPNSEEINLYSNNIQSQSSNTVTKRDSVSNVMNEDNITIDSETIKKKQLDLDIENEGDLNFNDTQNKQEEKNEKDKTVGLDKVLDKDGNNTITEDTLDTVSKVTKGTKITEDIVKTVDVHETKLTLCDTNILQTQTDTEQSLHLDTSQNESLHDLKLSQKVPELHNSGNTDSLDTFKNSAEISKGFKDEMDTENLIPSETVIVHEELKTITEASQECVQPDSHKVEIIGNSDQQHVLMKNSSTETKPLSNAAEIVVTQEIRHVNGDDAVSADQNGYSCEGKYSQDSSSPDDEKSGDKKDKTDFGYTRMTISAKEKAKGTKPYKKKFGDIGQSSDELNRASHSVPKVREDAKVVKSSSTRPSSLGELSSKPIRRYRPFSSLSSDMKFSKVTRSTEEIFIEKTPVKSKSNKDSSGSDSDGFLSTPSRSGSASPMEPSANDEDVFNTSKSTIFEESTEETNVKDEKLSKVILKDVFTDMMNRARKFSSEFVTKQSSYSTYSTYSTGQRRGVFQRSTVTPDRYQSRVSYQKGPRAAKSLSSLYDPSFETQDVTSYRQSFTSRTPSDDFPEKKTETTTEEENKLQKSEIEANVQNISDVQSNSEKSVKQRSIVTIERNSKYSYTEKGSTVVTYTGSKDQTDKDHEEPKNQPVTSQENVQIKTATTLFSTIENTSVKEPQPSEIKNPEGKIISANIVELKQEAKDPISTEVSQQEAGTTNIEAVTLKNVDNKQDEVSDLSWNVSQLSEKNEYINGEKKKEMKLDRFESGKEKEILNDNYQLERNKSIEQSRLTLSENITNKINVDSTLNTSVSVEKDNKNTASSTEDDSTQIENKSINNEKETVKSSVDSIEQECVILTETVRNGIMQDPASLLNTVTDQRKQEDDEITSGGIKLMPKGGETPNIDSNKETKQENLEGQEESTVIESADLMENANEKAQMAQTTDTNVPSVEQETINENIIPEETLGTYKEGYVPISDYSKQKEFDSIKHVHLPNGEKSNKPTQYESNDPVKKGEQQSETTDTYKLSGSTDNDDSENVNVESDKIYGSDIVDDTYRKEQEIMVSKVSFDFEDGSGSMLSPLKENTLAPKHISPPPKVTRILKPDKEITSPPKAKNEMNESTEKVGKASLNGTDYGTTMSESINCDDTIHEEKSNETDTSALSHSENSEELEYDIESSDVTEDIDQVTASSKRPRLKETKKFKSFETSFEGEDYIVVDLPSEAGESDISETPQESEVTQETTDNTTKDTSDISVTTQESDITKTITHEEIDTCLKTQASDISAVSQNINPTQDAINITHESDAQVKVADIFGAPCDATKMQETLQITHETNVLVKSADISGTPHQDVTIQETIAKIQVEPTNISSIPHEEVTVQETTKLTHETDISSIPCESVTTQEALEITHETDVQVKSTDTKNTSLESSTNEVTHEIIEDKIHIQLEKEPNKILENTGETDIIQETIEITSDITSSHQVNVTTQQTSQEELEDCSMTANAKEEENNVSMTANVKEEENNVTRTSSEDSSEKIITQKIKIKVDSDVREEASDVTETDVPYEMAHDNIGKNEPIDISKEGDVKQETENDTRDKVEAINEAKISQKTDLIQKTAEIKPNTGYQLESSGKPETTTQSHVEEETRPDDKEITNVQLKASETPQQVGITCGPTEGNLVTDVQLKESVVSEKSQKQNVSQESSYIEVSISHTSETINGFETDKNVSEISNLKHLVATVHEQNETVTNNEGDTSDMFTGNNVLNNISKEYSEEQNINDTSATDDPPNEAYSTPEMSVVQTDNNQETLSDESLKLNDGKILSELETSTSVIPSEATDRQEDDLEVNAVDHEGIADLPQLRENKKKAFKEQKFRESEDYEDYVVIEETENEFLTQDAKKRSDICLQQNEITKESNQSNANEQMENSEVQSTENVDVTTQYSTETLVLEENIQSQVMAMVDAPDILTGDQTAKTEIKMSAESKNKNSDSQTEGVPDRASQTTSIDSETSENKQSNTTNSHPDTFNTDIVKHDAESHPQAAVSTSTVEIKLAGDLNLKKNTDDPCKFLQTETDQEIGTSEHVKQQNETVHDTEYTGIDSAKVGSNDHTGDTKEVTKQDIEQQDAKTSLAEGTTKLEYISDSSSHITTNDTKHSVYDKSDSVHEGLVNQNYDVSESKTEDFLVSNVTHDNVTLDVDNDNATLDSVNGTLIEQKEEILVSYENKDDHDKSQTLTHVKSNDIDDKSTADDLKHHSATDANTKERVDSLDDKPLLQTDVISTTDTDSTLNTNLTNTKTTEISINSVQQSKTTKEVSEEHESIPADKKSKNKGKKAKNKGKSKDTSELEGKKLQQEEANEVQVHKDVSSTLDSKVTQPLEKENKYSKEMNDNKSGKEEVNIQESENGEDYDEYVIIETEVSENKIQSLPAETYVEGKGDRNFASEVETEIKSVELETEMSQQKQSTPLSYSSVTKKKESQSKVKKQKDITTKKHDQISTEQNENINGAEYQTKQPKEDEETPEYKQSAIDNKDTTKEQSSPIENPTSDQITSLLQQNMDKSKQTFDQAVDVKAKQQETKIIMSQQRRENTEKPNISTQNQTEASEQTQEPVLQEQPQTKQKQKGKRKSPDTEVKDLETSQDEYSSDKVEEYSKSESLSCQLSGSKTYSSVVATGVQQKQPITKAPANHESIPNKEEVRKQNKNDIKTTYKISKKETSETRQQDTTEQTIKNTDSHSSASQSTEHIVSAKETEAQEVKVKKSKSSVTKKERESEKVLSEQKTAASETFAKKSSKQKASSKKKKGAKRKNDQWKARDEDKKVQEGDEEEEETKVGLRSKPRTLLDGTCCVLILLIVIFIILSFTVYNTIYSNEKNMTLSDAGKSHQEL